jgi:hypothetical protein
MVPMLCSHEKYETEAVRLKKCGWLALERCAAARESGDLLGVAFLTERPRQHLQQTIQPPAEGWRWMVDRFGERAQTRSYTPAEETTVTTATAW